LLMISCALTRALTASGYSSARLITTCDMSYSRWYRHLHAQDSILQWMLFESAAVHEHTPPHSCAK
jgi:hypothetical protein